RQALWSIRAARARPTEKERPWPSAPAAFSTPGVVPSSGWPWRRLFSLRNVMSSSTGKNPRSARAAYQTGQAWPWLRTNRSREGMRVLRTSLAARASQEAKRVSEQDRKDDGDHHEPR